jgi:hypothetical protein
VTLTSAERQARYRLGIDGEEVRVGFNLNAQDENWSLHATSVIDAAKTGDVAQGGRLTGSGRRLPVCRRHWAAVAVPVGRHAPLVPLAFLAHALAACWPAVESSATVAQRFRSNRALRRCHWCAWGRDTQRVRGGAAPPQWRP